MSRGGFHRIGMPVYSQGSEFPISQGRSIITATPDDLIFECSCGTRRVFGKVLGMGKPPDNKTPLLNCWGKAHDGIPKLTVHKWIKPQDHNFQRKFN